MLPSMNISYILANILLLLLLSISYHQTTSAADSSALVGKSFSVRSSVTVIFENQESYTTRIHESYSAEQNRAKLDYQVIKGTKINNDVIKDIQPEKGSIYYEPQTETFILFDPTRLDCKETNLEEIAKIIKLEVPDQEPDLVADDYIIGPARLLFFIDKHSHEMKLLTLEKPWSVRNIPCEIYIFEYQTKYELFKFYVYYSSDSLSKQTSTNGREETPLMVMIEFVGGKNKQAVLIVQYFDFEIIKKGNTAGINKVQTWYDPFIIEPVTSCSQALANKAIDIFGNKNQNEVKFSFKAEFDIAKFPMSAYVSYDAKLGILRYDLIDETGSSGVIAQLFDLHQNKMYHVMEKKQNSKTTIDEILNLSLNDDSTTQCLTAKIVPSLARLDKSSNPFSLGKLLVGSDKFVYLGRAQVRGLDVKVYEAHVGGLPFWFEQPVVYKASRDKENEYVRNPENGLLKSDVNIQYTVLLYFADKQDNNPLVMIELYKMDSLKSITWSKQTIKINDFVWDLDFRTAHGDDMERLFSLQELCSSKPSFRNAKVDLLLESENIDTQTALSTSNIANNNIRYLTLLSAIQDTFNLPAPMIYDLESRILKPHNSPILLSDSKIANKLLMGAAFRVSELTEEMAQLIYVGQGTDKQRYSCKKVVYVTRSFQACFFLAAHRRANTYFAFNSATKRCVVTLNPIEDDNSQDVVDDSKQDCFYLNSKEKMEVYRTNHVKDPEPNYWIKSMYYSRNRLQYFGSKLKLDDLSDDKANELSSIEFTVKHFAVDEKDYKVSISTGDKSDKNLMLVKTDRIDGFGLIGGGEIEDNKRVSPVSLNSYNWSPLTADLEDKSSTMTLQQCEAACAANLDCKSYSICLKNNELECIISKMSFRSPDVIKQMNEKGKQVRRGEKVSVVLDGINQIKTELIKNPTCQLFNMIFLNLFRKETSIIIWRSFRNRRIYPVKDIEECAKLCVEKNLLIWQDDTHQSAEAFSKFNSKFDISKEDLIGTFLNQHRKKIEQINRSFYYMDKTMLLPLSKNIVDKVENRILELDKIDSTLVEGYCIVGENLKEDEKKSLEDNNKYDQQDKDVNIPLSSYLFKFDLFYEKQYGVQLLASPMSTKQSEAYKLVFREGSEATDETYSIVRQMTEQGNNFQETLYYDSSGCAKVCFLQSWGPWPACRSFDIIIEIKNDGVYASKCILNSITLRQAVSTNRLDLINDDTKDNPNVLQIYHYEPRPGLARDESDLSAKSEMIQGESIEQKSLQKLGYKIGGLGTFLIVVIALTGGILTGIKLGQKLNEKIWNALSGGSSIFHRDRDSLVRRTSRIEFNNIVNDEGVVAG